VNFDTLETANGSNGGEVNGRGDDDLEETWRQMREVVDEIERNYGLDEIPEDDWKIYVEYCAALGQGMSVYPLKFGTALRPIISLQATRAVVDLGCLTSISRAAMRPGKARYPSIRRNCFSATRSPEPTHRSI
jgi:hypothetical protein